MHKTKFALCALLAATAVATAPLAAAADGAELFKSKTCVACHGPEGKKPIMPIYPKLAGQNKDYLAAQMKDIKSGARNNGQTAAMKGVMGLVNEQEIDTIADWLSKL